MASYQTPSPPRPAFDGEGSHGVVQRALPWYAGWGCGPSGRWVGTSLPPAAHRRLTEDKDVLALVFLSLFDKDIQQQFAPRHKMLSRVCARAARPCSCGTCARGGIHRPSHRVRRVQVADEQCGQNIAFACARGAVFVQYCDCTADHFLIQCGGCLPLRMSAMHSGCACLL